MPVVKQHFAMRIASLTAFLRFEAGLVQGQELEEGDSNKEENLKRRVRKLQSSLSESQRRLRISRRRLRDVSLPQRWIWTAYIVSDKHRFVFLANHKVATTSILISLLPLFDFDDVEGENFDDLRSGPTFKHNGVPIGDVHGLFNNRGAHINKAHFLAGMGDKYHRYFKFTFVRNPWDRLVSCYTSKIVQGGGGMQMKYGDISLQRDMEFKEFAEAVCRIPDEISNHHFRSQHVTICDDGPRKAVFADFVGRFENLEKDFGFVAERIGLEPSLPQAGASRSRNSRSYRDFYDERLARMVGERYREDANLFGYSF